MKTLLYILISLATPFLLALIVNFISHDGWDLIGYGLIGICLLLISVLVQQVVLIFVYAFGKMRCHFPFVFTSTQSILMIFGYGYFTYAVWIMYANVRESLLSGPNVADPAIEESFASPFVGGHLFLLLPMLLQVAVVIMRVRWGRRLARV